MVHIECNDHDYKSFLITCDCRDLGHVLRLSYFIYTFENGTREISDAEIEMVANPFWPWPKRLWYALAYFINPHLCLRHSHYDSLVISIKDLQALSNVLFCLVTEAAELKKDNKRVTFTKEFLEAHLGYTPRMRKGRPILSEEEAAKLPCPLPPEPQESPKDEKAIECHEVKLTDEEKKGLCTGGAKIPAPKCDSCGGECDKTYKVVGMSDSAESVFSFYKCEKCIKAHQEKWK